MQNILELLKEFGLDLPENQKKAFENAVLKNYRTIADYNKQKKKMEHATNARKAQNGCIQIQILTRNESETNEKGR